MYLYILSAYIIIKNGETNILRRMAAGGL